MGHAIFILSTGRCGTQWIATQIAKAYGDVYTVEHEPLHSSYHSRKMIGGNSLDVLTPEEAQPIREHLARIEKCLERSNYLECGHPCWGALPFLAAHLKGAMRVIHLTRHPLPTALSWLTHGAFQKPILPHLKEKVLLTPFDEGVAYPEYRATWNTLTPFEKCLYYWLEVNALGIGERYNERIGVPQLRLSYEALFSGTGLAQLLDFLGLPHDRMASACIAERVDNFCYFTLEQPNFSALQQHPTVLELAGKLGYEAGSEVDINTLMRRYMGC